MCSSSPRGVISRPRSAPACSIADRRSLSMSFSRTISPETACDILITVARSSCSTGASNVPVGPGARSSGNPRHGVPLLRVHSQCVTGEVLGSLRCDCSGQLELAMQAIAQEGRGLVIYEYQEGRGIGLIAKLQAYELQDAGIDTIEANHALGFKADFRDFSLAAAILHDLRIPRVRLLTNNPCEVH